MIEISKEEFVKRYLEKIVRQKGDKEYHTPRAKTEYGFITSFNLVLVDANALAELKKLIKNFPIEEDRENHGSIVYILWFEELKRIIG